jgi:hypothetical protein
MMQRNTGNPPTTIVMWVLWGAFASALVMYRQMLVGKTANTHSLTAPDSPLGWVLYLIPIAVVMSVRWLVIPRLRDPRLVMPPFIVGFAFTEALTFFGIFLLPKQFCLFYFTSWFLILQLMPLWKQNPDQSGSQ